MKKILIIIFILNISLFANNCSPYYNPEKFYDAPQYLVDLIDESLNDLKLFGKEENYKTLSFKKQNSYFTNDYIKLNEYYFPKKSGLFTYKLKDSMVDEFTIATVNLYKYSDEEIANEINNDFEGFWLDWIEDGYEMQLEPQQVLFNYNGKYFSFSVYIYGVKGDTTRLEGTTIKYWFKDYTKEVNEYIVCSNKVAKKLHIK